MCVIRVKKEILADMKCPICNFPDSRVLDSRPVEDGASIKRRRECPNCGRRFTTYEVVDTVPITVTKRDGKLNMEITPTK